MVPLRSEDESNLTSIDKDERFYDKALTLVVFGTMIMIVAIGISLILGLLYMLITAG